MKIFRLICVVLILAFVLSAVSELSRLNETIDNVSGGSSSVTPPSSDDESGETETPTDPEMPNEPTEPETPTEPDEPSEECSHAYLGGVCSLCGDIYIGTVNFSCECWESGAGSRTYILPDALSELEYILDTETDESYRRTYAYSITCLTCNAQHSGSVLINVEKISSSDEPTDPETPTEPEEECSHTYSGGVCTECGEECSHIWEDDFCSICGEPSLPEMPIPDTECSHSFVNGVCTKCGAGGTTQV